ncbi:family S53 protease [Pilatotrama ljubarskyi]|nr:family S53 protease [Pilatotrama ljubarskyi]
MFSVALLVSYFAVVASGKPLARRMQVHETRSHIPPAFQEVGPAPPDAVLNLRVALVQGNFAGLEKALMDVSTPGSPSYGQHLSKAEVEAFVAPKPESVAAVNAWLNEQGIEATKLSPAGDWLSFSAPVSKASSLLDAQFSVFNHTPSGSTIIRTHAYSIPADLKGHLDLVHPTTAFTQPFKGPVLNFVPSSGNRPTPAVNLSSDAVPASCQSEVTPACLQALYGIPSAPATVSTNRLGVSGFLDQFANQQDLQTFLTSFRPDMPATTTFSLETLDGGSNPQVLSQAGVEADLDTEYTVGIATGVPITFISVGLDNSDEIDGFLDIINFLLDQDSPPQVLSTSYGGNEPDPPVAVLQNLCNAYAQLGARGTSILFASGDGGVSGIQTQQCTTFVPTFPSGCPYVTSIGATTGIGPEIAASFSGGGFSNIFPRPSYQDAAVSAFLTSINDTNAGLFNPGGRGFPDISAQGQNIEIVSRNRFGEIAGTSCSTPIMASVIALLNDELAAAGKPPLGFLNPFLYSSTGSAAFTDITIGNNPACNTEGFAAGPGWDPVTGLGTPNYAALRLAVGL